MDAPFRERLHRSVNHSLASHIRPTSMDTDFNEAYWSPSELHTMVLKHTPVYLVSPPYSPMHFNRMAHLMPDMLI